MSSIEELIIHPSVRPQQKSTYDFIIENWGNYSSFLCSLPTGTGKTDIAACLISKYIKEFPDAVIDILVPFKMHQDFWIKTMNVYADKHKFKVATLKGRGSYYCSRSSNKRADLAPCAFNSVEFKNCTLNCQLKRARKKIRKSQVRVLNWWIYKYMDFKDEKPDIRIFDEAHNLLNLEHLLRVELSRNFFTYLHDPNNEIDSRFNLWIKEKLKNKKYVSIDLEEAIPFLRSLLAKITETEVYLAEKIKKKAIMTDDELLVDLKRVSEVHQTLSDLLKDYKSKDISVFLIREQKNPVPKLVVQPFEISYIFEELFKANKNLLLSATIGDGDYLAKLLGMQDNEYAIIRKSSSFDKDNHPFILLKESQNLSTSRDKKEETFEILRKQIRPFLKIQKSLRLRGLVVTPSFELASIIKKEAQLTKINTISHKAGGSGKAVQQFINERKGDLLITPVAWEGISLDDDLARLCYIPKMPFPYLGDPIVQRKTKKYPDFMKNEVLISIQQAHGRIQRNKDDWGVTICFDGNFRWLSSGKSKRSLEPWFISRIKEIPLNEAQDIIKAFSKKFSRGTAEKLRLTSRMNESDKQWLIDSGLIDKL